MRSAGDAADLIVGIVDLKRRPIVELMLRGGRTLRCLVDTGFGKELLVDQPTADAIGVTQSRIFGHGPRADENPILTTVDGRPIRVLLGSVAVMWGGAERLVGVQILEVGVITVDTSDPYAPAALIGCAMFDDAVLEIDFVAKSLAVRNPAANP